MTILLVIQCKPNCLSDRTHGHIHVYQEGYRKTWIRLYTFLLFFLALVNLYPNVREIGTIYKNCTSNVRFYNNCYHPWSIALGEYINKIEPNCNFVSVLRHSVWLQLSWHFLDITFQLFLNTVWLRITKAGSAPEMRIWSILWIKSDSNWCIHVFILPTFEEYLDQTFPEKNRKLPQKFAIMNKLTADI